MPLPTPSRTRSRLTVSVCAFFVTALAMAQPARTRMVPVSVNDVHSVSPPAGNSDFGTTDLTYVRVTGFQFTTYAGGPYAAGSGLSRYPLNDEPLEASVYIPSGAIVESVQMDYFDSNPSQNVGLAVADCGATAESCDNTLAHVMSTGSAGFGQVATTGIGYPWSNLNNSLLLEVTMGAHDGSVGLTSAIIGYRLQVSPAPVTPTFADVPASSIYYQFIEALAASGVTGGCDAGLYCPDRAITRAEMAVFLAKALGLHFPN